MGNFSPAVDQIIAKAQPFAQPILNHLREIVHAVCPETEEKIKWGMPFFEYRGKNLCHIAAFKNHCALGFWLQSLMSDPENLLAKPEEGGMGSLGKIRSFEGLPTVEQLQALLTDAMMLIEKGAKIVKTKEKPELVVPEILAEALKKDKVAAEAFEKFSYSHRKEYINWINGAKTAETKSKRTEKTILNLNEGKSKEWKYQ